MQKATLFSRNWKLLDYNIYLSVTKHVTGSDQNIAIQVCHSTECDGTERWDRSKGSNLEHIYIEDALGESKLSDRYTLERNDNCSILSIENVTKEDIFNATYQFVIGTSDKIPIQLKHEPSKFNIQII